ncbi:hypothetical protein GCM10009872_39720 [Actinopolymorpha rutila]
MDVVSHPVRHPETGLVDLERAYVIGHSYGGNLVNRIVTNEHPFRAAVCWESLCRTATPHGHQRGDAEPVGRRH